MCWVTSHRYHSLSVTQRGIDGATHGFLGMSSEMDRMQSVQEIAGKEKQDGSKNTRGQIRATHVPHSSQVPSLRPSTPTNSPSPSTNIILCMDKNLRSGRTGAKTVSSRCDRIIVPMNSQQLWLSAQDQVSQA